jgi:hypothetical protein
MRRFHKKTYSEPLLSVFILVLFLKIRFISPIYS